MDRIIKVLIVEKGDYCHYFFSKIICFDNFQYNTESMIEDALNICEKIPFDLIMFNLDMVNNGTVGTVIKRIRDVAAKTSIVIVAEKKDAEETVRGMKSGASNVIFKPFLNIAEVKQEIMVTLEGDTAQDHVSREWDNGMAGCGLYDTYGIVGISPNVRQLYEVIKRIAPIDVNILIIGESGTGKELIAKAIHAHSQRSEKDFMAVNCGALPEGLVESSFFGYEKGAFTGANTRVAGYFEEADGGTIFLDEIGSMSQRAQVALLRVLQEKKYIRVGGTRALKVDARIIASTNTNLRQAMEEGQFRADLYYRLNVVSIKTAPLRERKEDIPVLVSYFIKQVSAKYGIPRKSITPQAMEILKDYNWPGNIRELENFIEGVVALTPQRKTLRSIDLEELKKRTQKAIGSGDMTILDHLLDVGYEEAKEGFERYYFMNLLQKKNGNIRHSARFAKIHPATLHRKINRLKIRPQENRNRARA